VCIESPPLRERREDISQLFEHFSPEAALVYSSPGAILSQTQLTELMAYDWPGNVRESQNMACRSALGIRVPVLPYIVKDLRAGILCNKLLI
jgi:DNA-binding NtrC family response regulator